MARLLRRVASSFGKLADEVMTMTRIISNGGNRSGIIRNPPLQPQQIILAHAFLRLARAVSAAALLGPGVILPVVFGGCGGDEDQSDTSETSTEALAGRCGNGVCGRRETCSNCPADCGPCAPKCGD